MDIQASGLLSPNQSLEVDDYSKYSEMPARGLGPVGGESLLVISSGSEELSPESLMKAEKYG